MLSCMIYERCQGDSINDYCTFQEILVGPAHGKVKMKGHLT